jgi:hypothetical protein
MQISSAARYLYRDYTISKKGKTRITTVRLPHTTLPRCAGQKVQMPRHRGRLPTTLFNIHRLTRPPLSCQKRSLIASITHACNIFHEINQSSYMEVITICTTYFNAKNHIMSGQFVRFSIQTTICSLNIIKQPMFFYAYAVFDDK